MTVDAVERLRIRRMAVRVLMRLRRRSRLGSGGSDRQLERLLSRRPAGADSRAVARRLPRPADQRQRPRVRRSLGRLTPHHPRASVPGALVAVYPARPAEHAHLGGTRSADPADRRDSPGHQQLSAAADVLDGRPAASVGVRRAHLDGLLDRPVGRRHAGRDDHAHQADVASPERHSRRAIASR